VISSTLCLSLFVQYRTGTCSCIRVDWETNSSRSSWFHTSNFEDFLLGFLRFCMSKPNHQPCWYCHCHGTKVWFYFLLSLSFFTILFVLFVYLCVCQILYFLPIDTCLIDKQIYNKCICGWCWCLLGFLLHVRLRERLKECNGDEVLKAEAASKVQRFTEWALKCIGSHTCRRRGGSQSGGAACDVVTTTTSAMHSLTAIESCRQLMAFKKFLDLAGFQLSKKDYTEAFDAACFPLTLFSNAIDPGWATGLAASPMQGLLGLLVERGADNVNQCFLEAARFGSTELVRIFLQVSHTLHLMCFFVKQSVLTVAICSRFISVSLFKLEFSEYKSCKTFERLHFWLSCCPPLKVVLLSKAETLYIFGR